ncbi:MAG: nuclear transport factor 2 family protein [bacterium]|nr:nuclear transport factor 2 family protein [bacterium]
MLGLGMALLMVVAGVFGWWVGSSGGDDVPPEIESILNRFDEAWHAGDAAALASLYTENATYEEPSYANIERGPSSIENHVALAMRYVDYAELERGAVLVAEDVVIAETTVSGMSSELGRDPDDRTPFETTVVSVHEIEDGLITKTIMYYDPAEMFN